jgi:hypothetical protein
MSVACRSPRDLWLAGGAGHVNHDLPSIGELDRVSNQVDHDLPQAAHVTHQRNRYIRLHLARQLEPLLVRPQGKRLHRIGETLAQVEIDGIELELARFDLREIKDVVDDRQEPVR